MYKRRYRLSRRAINDLHGVWSDMQHNDPAAADELLKRIKSKVEFACVYPHNGLVRPEIHDNARILVDGPFNIMYEVQENDVLVVAIVHSGFHPV